MSDFDIFCLVALLIYQFCKLSNIRLFLSTIHEFDKKVSFIILKLQERLIVVKKIKAATNGIQMNWKLHKRCFCAIVFSVVLVFAFVASFYSIMEFFIALPPIPLLVSSKYSFVEFFRSVYLAQFVLASSTLLVRFKTLNERIVLLNFAHSAKDASVVAQLHRQLCDGIEILNQTFTFQLIPIFAILMASMN